MSKSGLVSNWSVGKKILGGLLVLGGLLTALLVVLEIDGRLHERWKHATNLCMLHKSWILDGSPQPIPDPRRYGSSDSGTAYVYTASQVMDGQTYGGLFAFHPYGQPNVFAITTNGVCLVLQKDGGARRMRIHKTRGAAW